MQLQIDNSDPSVSSLSPSLFPPLLLLLPRSATVVAIGYK